MLFFFCEALDSGLTHSLLHTAAVGGSHSLVHSINKALPEVIICYVHRIVCFSKLADIHWMFWALAICHRQWKIKQKFLPRLTVVSAIDLRIVGSETNKRKRRNEWMQWTERERTRTTLHTYRWLRKPVYESILLISIQFSTIISTFNWISLVPGHEMSFSGTKVNLLPQNFPETTKAAAIWNFARIRNRHFDVESNFKVSNHQNGIFPSSLSRLSSSFSLIFVFKHSHLHLNWLTVKISIFKQHKNHRNDLKTNLGLFTFNNFRVFFFNRLVLSFAIFSRSSYRSSAKANDGTNSFV